MMSSKSGEKVASTDSLSVADFNGIRKSITDRFFYDPSYAVFDAMAEMSASAEEYISSIATHYPANVLWVGGSLGRREMLPNSDVDLFVIYDNEDSPQNEIRVEGVDKFEVGHIDKKRLEDLLRFSFVDANRFIDGRNISAVPARDVEMMIERINTPDRQLANNISEYFYYRYFDFNQKTTSLGPNLKYSTGSTRDTIFFNMVSRMSTGSFPATRGNEPELAEVLKDTESRYGLKPPLEAVNLLFIVKNVAISIYDATGDIRSKYVSHVSLEAIFDYCKPKFQALGYKNYSQFIDGYMAARKEIEFTVDTLFTKALEEHPANHQIEKLLELSGVTLTEACVKEIETENSLYPQSLIALGAWLMMRNGAPDKDMNQIAESMMLQPIDKVWGGLMAVACSPNTPDSALSRLSDWLFENEKGAYLLKLITRNPSSSEQTRAKAKDYYRAKEIVI